MAGVVLGWYPFQGKIPNGNQVMRNGSVWPGVGHQSSVGSGAPNSFGTAFKNANYTWEAGLCAEDSDGDGQSNGLELGDPDCVWSEGQTPARTTDISHPGFGDSMTAAVPTPTPEPTPAPMGPTPVPTPPAADEANTMCSSGTLALATALVTTTCLVRRAA